MAIKRKVKSVSQTTTIDTETHLPVEVRPVMIETLVLSNPIPDAVYVKGDKGNTGDKGDTGIGEKGDQGIQGIKGDKGDKGDTGIGEKGDQGIQGIKGDTGDIIFQSVDILDNQVIPKLLFSYPATYNFSFLLCSIYRNNGFKMALYESVTNGIILRETSYEKFVPSPDVTGVTITKAVVGANVEVYYTSTNTGNNGVFKYASLTQWS